MGNRASHRVETRTRQFRDYIGGIVDGVGVVAAPPHAVRTRGASPAARVHIAGNLSDVAWSTTGKNLAVSGNTLTDTSSSGGATVTTRAGSTFGQPSFASTNTVTVTNAATRYVANAPATGTNTTITNSYALYVGAGGSYLGGTIVSGGNSGDKIHWSTSGTGKSARHRHQEQIRSPTGLPPTTAGAWAALRFPPARRTCCSRPAA